MNSQINVNTHLRGLLSDLQIQMFVHRQLVLLISPSLLREYLYKRQKGRNTGEKEQSLIIY